MRNIKDASVSEDMVAVQDSSLSRMGVLLAILMVLAIPVQTCSGQKIRTLLTGQVDKDSNPLLKWFGEEPLVEGLFVPTRPCGVVDIEDIMRFVRIYFPRTYEEVRSHDFIIGPGPRRGSEELGGG